MPAMQVTHLFLLNFIFINKTRKTLSLTRFRIVVANHIVALIAIRLISVIPHTTNALSNMILKQSNIILLKK